METGIVKDRIECSGAIIVARTTRRLILLQKTNGKHKDRWTLPGGTHHNGESPWQGLTREVNEELGFTPAFLKTFPVEKFVSNDQVFTFQTYLCVVETEFIPQLSKEHKAWGWFHLDSLPKPIHKALEQSFRNKVFQIKLSTIFDILDTIT